MQTTRIALALLALMMFTTGATAQDRPINFDGAKWIWYSPGAEAAISSLPAAVNYFRRQMTLPERAEIESAEVIVTCDNLFVLYINGKSVGESEAHNNAWKQPKRWDVTGLLTPGSNVVAIQAVNTLPGPAGLIVKLVVRLTNGRTVRLVTDGTWLADSREHASWQVLDFDDTHWNDARVVRRFGDGPWRRVEIDSPAVAAGTPIGKVAKVSAEAMSKAAKTQRITAVVEETPSDDYPWPRAIVFLGDDCSLYRPLAKDNTRRDSLNVMIFSSRKSRAFPEHDLPAPMKVGRKLYLLEPAEPGVEPRLLLDAGRGGIGSPSVSFDGRSILVSMADDGEPFFHLYRLTADGGSPERLTDGPFHDIDPAELPDGRIVFTSTRIGTFEEYHSPPSRALFVMNADGSDVRPLTNTIIFDNEPEVLADGRIVFIRSDNFFDRGKVETLLHALHTDGTHGYTEFGLNVLPEYGRRLRAFHCGSPAPMPDGRLAFLSVQGITIGRLGAMNKDIEHYSISAGDVAALPDGRLLCTTARNVPVEIPAANGTTRTVNDLRYEKIAILDPRVDPPTLTVLRESSDGPLHSPVYLGPRQRPPLMAEKVDRIQENSPQATGVLFCQNARFTQKTTAGWSNVRAIRVLAGTGLTTRSSHSYIVHAGNETVELGTVPLAPDGSFSIEVPADTPIALQAVDAEGRSELNEMSWIYVRPGERRGCVGCHQPRQAAPLSTDPLPLALKTRPLRLLDEGQPHRFRGNNAAVTGLMELQFDRYREVAGINRYEETDEIALLIDQLGGRDNGRKISAANRLSVFRTSSAAPALAECLTDPHREVRVAAAIALAACGTRESVQPLLAALNDSDPLVAQAAAIALENLTAHAEPFDGFAEANERWRQATAWSDWFQNTPWQDIERELIARLESPDRDIARRAAVALGHTGGQSARNALRQYVVANREINPYPDWKAGHRGDGTQFNSLADVNPRTLQAATRAIGHLADIDAVDMLAETIAQHDDPASGNLFLAEAAVEALGRIGTPQAEAALIEAFTALGDYPTYTVWYGDHTALMSCHASPIHYFIIESLDRLRSTTARSIVPHLIRSVPIDPDRALLLGNDDYETLTGRVIRRNGSEAAVVETCLAILGDPKATRDEEIETAISTIIRCWAGDPTAENRAAQILSLVCRDGKYEPAIRAAFERYRAKSNDIPRVFDTGIPQVQTLPVQHWVCFYLARSLGNLADPQSVATLIASLDREPTEAAAGRPDPLGPGVLFLHNDLTPCWRAATAWALGQIGDHRATPVLLSVVGNLENATDTRHAAAKAIGLLADPSAVEPLSRLAEDYPEISTRRALQKAAQSR